MKREVKSASQERDLKNINKDKGNYFKNFLKMGIVEIWKRTKCREINGILDLTHCERIQNSQLKSLNQNYNN